MSGLDSPMVLGACPLAIQRKAAVYTTDAAWKKLGLSIEVNVIR